ncbi:hypothetical protein [Microbacterium sp. LKL04]|uniref:hypothetical protein n=1 Tax=Microbacterium sp. LKL04 TaxID=912630 RepID=UPI000B86EDC6|nr:hypothetical protein [Microbacterium sp. LKL04]
MSRHETHEPDFEANWPHGHVGVAEEADGADPLGRLNAAKVAAARTDADADECMVVRLGVHDHFLHAQTTKALLHMVNAHGDRAAAVTVHGVTHLLDPAAVRALSEELDAVVVGFFGDPSIDPRE